MIEHRAFATSARDHSKAMGINSSSRVLQFSSYVFDVSVMDMLTTLMQGGCICIPTDEERGSMEIVGAISRMRVNWTLLTPSFVTIIEPSLEDIGAWWRGHVSEAREHLGASSEAHERLWAH
jgi:non-ribosomal peptide synthetase component F